MIALRSEVRARPGEACGLPKGVALVADSKSARTRPRAVGTRDRIMSHLALTGEVKDEHGMASGVLAREVGYPGSSIAFAQLLSGMERSGLIRRDVRGKRTYRITPSDDALLLGAAKRSPRRRPAAVGSPNDFDYEELARQLLLQVLRQLAAPEFPGEPNPAWRAAGPGTPGAAEQAGQASGGDTGAMGRAMAALEQELASVRTMQGMLSTENARLREQLRAVQRSLELAQQRTGQCPAAEHLDAADVGMLESMLSPAADPKHTEDPR
jgi:hypothetical protein